MKPHNLNGRSPEEIETPELQKILKTKQKALRSSASGPNEVIEKEIQLIEAELKKREISETTTLSEREAELYVLTEKFDLTVQEAADEMGIKYGNASGKRTRIREKIEKAEKTAELSI